MSSPDLETKCLNLTQTHTCKVCKRDGKWLYKHCAVRVQSTSQRERIWGVKFMWSNTASLLWYIVKLLKLHFYRPHFYVFVILLTLNDVFLMYVCSDVLDSHVFYNSYNTANTVQSHLECWCLKLWNGLCQKKFSIFFSCCCSSSFSQY